MALVFPWGFSGSTPLLYIVIATTITKQQTSVEYLKCARSFNPPNSFFLVATNSISILHLAKAWLEKVKLLT